MHVSTDGTTVINRGEWTDEEAYRTSFRENPSGGVLHALGTRPGVLAATVFSGAPAAAPLEGPEPDAQPGVVGVATRHLGGPASAGAVLDLLAKSGEWKRHHPGFISATPYVDKEGATFVNYPMWVNEVAYQAWMADPPDLRGAGGVGAPGSGPAPSTCCAGWRSRSTPREGAARGYRGS
ncbi:antibiotic biosynthesis monooxygenase [Streptomyces thinghirensis]|nr:antibiotic biosynthesis monooxygenase [Streptomyces thinghirensis]